MKRPRLLTLLIVVLFVVGAGGIIPSRVEAAVTTLPVIVLAQSDFFVTDEFGCDVETSTGVDGMIRIENQEGRQTGGFSLNSGEVIAAVGPSNVNQSYCAFVKAVDIGASGVVRIELNDRFLMALDVDTFNPSRYLLLEVNSKRLVAMDYAKESEVSALGLEPLDLTQSTTSETKITRTPRTISTEPTPTEASTGITRTPRTSSVEVTPTAVSMPADASVALDNSRDKLRESTPQAGVVPGEWDLEEPPMLNFLFVEIEEDTEGVGSFGLMLLDPEDLEEIWGFPVLSEDTAPEGCRAFTMQGPYQSVVFMGMCADEEYLMFAMGSDQDVVHSVMRDFVDGKPFTVPQGYEEVPETWQPAVRGVA